MMINRKHCFGCELAIASKGLVLSILSGSLESSAPDADEQQHIFAFN